MCRFKLSVVRRPCSSCSASGWVHSWVFHMLDETTSIPMLVLVRCISRYIADACLTEELTHRRDATGFSDRSHFFMQNGSPGSRGLRWVKTGRLCRTMRQDETYRECPSCQAQVLGGSSRSPVLTCGECLLETETVKHV